MCIINIGILAIDININLQFTENHQTMTLQETNDVPTGKIHVQRLTVLI